MAERRKKGISGCAIATFVVMGIVAAAMALAGYGIYRALQTEEGQQFAELITGTTSWLMNAASAPGAAELRDAGCAQALVSTVGEIAALSEKFESDAEPPALELGDEADMPVLTCITDGTGNAPDCKTVLDAYLGAVSPAPARIVVSVDAADGPQDACSGIYDPAGSRVGELDEVPVLQNQPDPTG